MVEAGIELQHASDMDASTQRDAGGSRTHFDRVATECRAVWLQRRESVLARNRTWPSTFAGSRAYLLGAALGMLFGPLGILFACDLTPAPPRRHANKKRERSSAANPLPPAKKGPWHHGKDSSFSKVPVRVCRWLGGIVSERWKPHSIGTDCLRINRLRLRCFRFRKCKNLLHVTVG